MKLQLILQSIEEKIQDKKYTIIGFMPFCISVSLIIANFAVHSFYLTNESIEGGIIQSDSEEDFEPNELDEPSDSSDLDGLGEDNYAEEQEEENSFQNKTVIVEQGDTLVGILNNAGLEEASSYLIANAANKVYNFSQIQVGQSINVDLTTWKSEMPADKKLNLCTLGNKIEVTHDEHNNMYSAKLLPVETFSKNNLIEGVIKTNLYDNASNLGAPSSVIMQYIKLLNYEIDFQRDIAPGASFKIMYDYKVNDKGNTISNGNIIYAVLSTRDKSIEIYKYEDKNGNVDYFDKKGNNIRKSLLKTPVKNAYISSGFGPRRHPILGYSRMHKGLDYAAPRGTPIYAAGNGIVQDIKYTRGYGRYIKIKHNNTYSTLYAHLDRFSKKIKRGVRVKQGDVIGTVGTTGMATGPHLHYEVHKNGVQVNPAKVNFPISNPLKGRELIAFKSQRSKIDKMIQHEFYVAEIDRKKHIN